MVMERNRRGKKNTPGKNGEQKQEILKRKKKNSMRRKRIRKWRRERQKGRKHLDS